MSIGTEMSAHRGIDETGEVRRVPVGRGDPERPGRVPRTVKVPAARSTTMESRVSESVPTVPPRRSRQAPGRRRKLTCARTTESGSVKSRDRASMDASDTGTDTVPCPRSPRQNTRHRGRTGNGTHTWTRKLPVASLPRDVTRPAIPEREVGVSDPRHAVGGDDLPADVPR